MGNQPAAGGLWSSVRDLNVGYVTIFAGAALLLVALYLFRFRSASVSVGDMLPSLDRLENIGFWTAAAFIVLALATVVYEMFQPLWTDDDATLASVWSTFKLLSPGYIFILVAFVLLLAGNLWLRTEVGSFRAIWNALTADNLRSYAIATALLLLVAIVVISAVRTFWPFGVKGEFASVAPFTISGNDDKQKGLALANGFQAKLMEIKRDTQVMDEVLHSEDRDTDQPTSQDKSESESLNVYRKVELELKFQGVDVGGLLNWAFDWFATRRAMQITIAEQGDKAVVSGALRADGRSFVYANVENKNDRIVAAVAYSKLRETLVAQQAEFQGLEWSDIEKLHHTIMSVIQLRSRSESKVKDYQEHHLAMADLIAKAPRQESLLTLGSEIAMKAGEIDSALAYLDRSNDSLVSLRENLERARQAAANKPNDAADADDGDESGKLSPNGELRKLQRDFSTRYNALLVQRQRIVSSCALPLVDRLNAREAPETVFVDAIARHKDLLKIAAVEKKRPAKVAIVGGMPQREPMRYRFASKGAWSPGKFGLDNFADTIGLIVSALAPQAELVFVPLGPKSRTRGLTLLPDEREVAAALDTAAEAAADIVLIPFALQLGSGGAWAARFEAIKRHAGKMIVISTAISKSTQEQKQNKGLRLPDLDALFIGSVDVDGGYKGATLSTQEVFATYPGAVWAPGTRIPRLTGDGTWQTTYGSSYAVATAGAAIANIVLATPDKAPGEIMAAVRKSVQSLDRRDPTIGVIDQRAALNELAITVAPDKPAPATKDVCAKNASPPA